MSEAAREQGLVFGEVAEQYDEARPGYPDAVFDTIMEFGELQRSDRALEIGAGTGKATMPFVARGLDITALEPSPGMAAVLRAKGIDVIETKFGSWELEPEAFRLVYAAQAWHWVHDMYRYEFLFGALVPGGVFAPFWNVPHDWEGQLGADKDAVYERYTPNLVSVSKTWNVDRLLEEFGGDDMFTSAEKVVIPWTQTYSRAEYVRLLGTHSDHRILPEEQRTALHDALGAVIDAHGGSVDVNYDVNLYLTRRL